MDQVYINNQLDFEASKYMKCGIKHVGKGGEVFEGQGI